MGRLIRTAFLPVLLVPAVWATGALVGCSSSSEQPEGEISPADQAEVQEVMAHYNNDSSTERWRERMVELGGKSPAHKRLVLDTLEGEVQRSLQRGGTGPGVLRPPGRRRAMETAARLGDDPVGRKVLAAGLEDSDLDVKAAAGAGLAAWGDPSPIPTLVVVVMKTKDGEPARALALQGLRRLASAGQREPLLGALRGEAREALEPVLLSAFPEADGERRAALRTVAASHRNPHARAFALQWLAAHQDPSTPELAQKALNDGDPALRPTALAALGATGGEQGAEELEQLLLKDPKDAVSAARGLYKVGSAEAVDRAANVFQRASLSAATRNAVAQEVLGRLREKGAPAAYREETTLERGREPLRAAIEARDEGVLQAAAAALGKIGAPGSDVDLLLGLLQTPDPATSQVVVTALGHLGGPVAAAQLVDFLGVDPNLRGASAEALAGFADPADVPMEALIDLLEHEDLAVREAAIKALRGLSRGQVDIAYDPHGEPGARAKSAQRWREWWSARRGGR